MGADDDLRINTLHRFAKHSPRLTLREYSHCEVPAGCGGVVLRWTDPRLGLPVFISAVGLNGVTDVWLDGVQVPTSATSLRSGAHVLALHVRPEEVGASLLLTIAIRSGTSSSSTDLLAGHSRARVTYTDPTAAFSAIEHNDRRWPVAVKATADDMTELQDWHRDRLLRLLDEGTLVLPLTAEAWIRVAFDVDLAQGQAGETR